MAKKKVKKITVKVPKKQKQVKKAAASKGRGPSDKSKNSKVQKLIRMSKAMKAGKKKGFFARLFGR